MLSVTTVFAGVRFLIAPAILLWLRLLRVEIVEGRSGKSISLIEWPWDFRAALSTLNNLNRLNPQQSQPIPVPSPSENE